MQDLQSRRIYLLYLIANSGATGHIQTQLLCCLILFLYSMGSISDAMTHKW